MNGRTSTWVVTVTVPFTGPPYVPSAAMSCAVTVLSKLTSVKFESMLDGELLARLIMAIARAWASRGLPLAATRAASRQVLSLT